jgi:hypothetical protein
MIEHLAKHGTNISDEVKEGYNLSIKTHTKT